MPRQETPSGRVLIAWDAARADRPCSSYRDGHNVHWIPVLRIAQHRPWVDAELTVEDGRLVLAFGTERSIVRHHDETGVRLLIESLGSSIRWYPSLRYACWPGEEVQRWASLALGELQPCFPPEPART